MPDRHTPNWPDIWFLRHGQTEWNLAGRIQGRLDSDLTALGRAQAQQQAGLMSDIAQRVTSCGGCIHVSPLGRARQTAALALPGRALTIDARLAEVATGLWEGLLKADLPQGETDLDTYTSAPGGEDLETLIARVRSFADDLVTPSIVVAHGMLGQVLRGLAQGINPDKMGAQDNGQGCVYYLSSGHETRLDKF